GAHCAFRVTGSGPYIRLFDFDARRDAPRTVPGGVDILIVGHGHAHAALDEAFGLAEQADFRLRNAQRLVHAFEDHAARVDASVDDGAGAGAAQTGVHGQAENGARVQLEFALPLADHGDQAGIMRTRTDLAEPYLVALDEQLYAEHAQAAEVVGHLAGNFL